MCTETTRKIRLNEGFIAKYNPLLFPCRDESYVAELAKKLGTKPELRSFFIDKSFPNFFDETCGTERETLEELEETGNAAQKNKKKSGETKGKKRGTTLLREFVQNTGIFPAVNFQQSEHGFLNFFGAMQNEADEIFKTHLGLGIAQVCEKAHKIGLFTAQSRISDEKLTRVKSSDNVKSKRAKNADALFYEIKPALFELWINPEGKAGRMMELWIYSTLKEHLKDTRFSVLHSVNVHESTSQTDMVKAEIRGASLIEAFLVTPSLDTKEKMKEELGTSGLSEEETIEQELGEEMTDIDCLVMDGEDVACFIECKKAKLGWVDVLKFYGSVKLFGAPFGVLISGRKGIKNLYSEYGCVKIFDNVINNEHFPSELLNYLDAKLGIT